MRRRIRQYVWLDGLAAAVAWLGVAFWLTLAADWFFEPSTAVRGVMLALVVLVLAAVAVRLIGRRAFVRITDGNAAMVLERRFPALNDALLTAVVLGNRLADDVNPEMLARTCREAATRIGDVDPRKAFNSRPLWLHGSAAMLLTLSMAFFAILFPGEFGVWARRALALSNEPWPRMTELTVVDFADGVRKVARGADLEVVVRANTHKLRVPRTVEVRYSIEGGGHGRATMDRRGVAGPSDDYQEYAYTFRGILADVHFDVVGGDDRVRDRWIQAVDSPTISQMTLDCKLPAYIGRRQPPLPVTGVMQIPVGSRVTVRAAEANKDLVSVEVGGVVEDRALPLRVLTERNLAADRRGFTYPVGPLMTDTTLLFTLADADAIKSREPIRVAMVAVPDQPPQMTVALDGIGTAITPLACLPAAGRITDDYGLGRVWFEYAIDQGKPSTRSIAKLDKAPEVFNLANAALELREMGLKPGQKLFVSVKAADLCDLGHGPNVAGTERWLLDVVTPEQLRAMLEARELVLRQRFEQMIQEMTETRDLLARMKFDSLSSPNVAQPPPAVRDKPTQPRASAPHKPVAEPGDEEPADSPAHQRDLRFLRVEGALTNCRKSTQEVLGLAEAFDDICKQLKNNRIDTQELKNRLQGGIAGPLHAMAAAMFPELERRLNDLQAVLDDGRQGPPARTRAQGQAEDILLTMRKVLDHMIELEDFNEAVEMLRTIVQAQKQLHQRTQEFHKQKIRELLQESAKQGKRASTDKLVEQERGIAGKYRHFEDVLMRMAELSAVSDPRRAALLRKAIAQSKDQLIAVAFERIVDLLDKERLSRALENQTQLDQDLRALLDLLMSENRAKSIENEKARVRDYLKQLGVIIKQQKDVQGRTTGGDDAKRLAGQQAKLSDKTGGLAKTIKENEEKTEDAARKAEGEGKKGEKGQKGEKEEGGKQKAKGGGGRRRAEARTPRANRRSSRRIPPANALNPPGSGWMRPKRNSRRPSARAPPKSRSKPSWRSKRPRPSLRKSSANSARRRSNARWRCSRPASAKCCKWKRRCMKARCGWTRCRRPNGLTTTRSRPAA